MNRLTERPAAIEPVRLLEQLALDMVDRGEFASLTDAVEHLEAALREPVNAE